MVCTSGHTKDVTQRHPWSQVSLAVRVNPLHDHVMVMECLVTTKGSQRSLSLPTSSLTTLCPHFPTHPPNHLTLLPSPYLPISLFLTSHPTHFNSNSTLLSFLPHHVPSLSPLFFLITLAFAHHSPPPLLTHILPAAVLFLFILPSPLSIHHTQLHITLFTPTHLLR